LKRILAIAVLFIFLVNTMGYYFVFRCNQYLIKQEMVSRVRKGIYHPDIVLLRILHPEKEPQYHRLGKNEFSYHGRLYDIVVERKSGDTTFFYCLHDKKEETLISDFMLYLRFNGHSGSSQKDLPIHELLQNLVTKALIQDPVPAPQDPGIAFAFPELQTMLIPVYLVHFTPPPESA